MTNHVQIPLVLPGLPTAVRVILETYRGKVCLAGGSVRKLFFGQWMGDSDFDLFFDSESTLESARVFAFSAYLQPTDNTEFAVTYTDEGSKVQLIKHSFYPGPRSVIAGFDLTIAQFATDGQFVYTTEDALRDEHAKALRVIPSSLGNPTLTLRRVTKFVTQGYKATAQTYADVLQAVVDNPALLAGDIYLRTGSSSE